jgi:TetR/AcrR family transcriptional regulator, fatty acid metabolism regulator protein
MQKRAKPVKKVRGEVRRVQIVQAALKIIGHQGMGGLTTAAIAREIGMSEANLYRHVKNKDEIYGACFEYVRNRIRENMDSAVAGADSPVKTLRRFFLLQVSLMEQNRGLPRFLFSDELHLRRKLREKIIKTMHAHSMKLASFIQEGQRQKLIRIDLNAETTALMLIGLVQGLTFRWSLSGFSFSFAREGMKLWKNFEKCISYR